MGISHINGDDYLTPEDVFDLVKDEAVDVAMSIKTKEGEIHVYTSSGFTGAELVMAARRLNYVVENWVFNECN